jgi:hypothetical protein
VVLNGWQYSGITSLTGGAPVNPTYSVSSGGSTVGGAQLNREITGNEGIAPRVLFTCNPMAGSSTEFLNTSCITAAPKGSAGFDSGYDRLRGPGYNNWDMSIRRRSSARPPDRCSTPQPPWAAPAAGSVSAR